ncbi:MAG TPA: glycosyltransferase [Vicinamibacterales bacterium]|jgi:hypothetical protein|nr:glycosyltransferase [Vicinamibacterales bacterium]
MTWPRVLLVADPSPTQLGAHLIDAANSLGVDLRLCATPDAYGGPALVRKASWWLGGRRPARLRAFSATVLETARAWRPDVVLTTGLAPVAAAALAEIGRLRIRRLNFSTDDPWNPAHAAPWFLRALPMYDVVFSPRRANLDDLRRAGVARVAYLPFGYNPRAHRPEPPATDAERARFAADVMLAGGADADRVRVVAPLIDAGFSVALYGGYWTRFAATRRHARGMLDEAGLRRATATAKVCLGLVRRANRDGHAMRTFEVPAMNGCLLAERTPDHTELFGADGLAVRYFERPDEAVEQVAALLADAGMRDRLVARAHEIVVTGRHTYADRLATMLTTTEQQHDA